MSFPALRLVGTDRSTSVSVWWHGKAPWYRVARRPWYVSLCKPGLFRLQYGICVVENWQNEAKKIKYKRKVLKRISCSTFSFLSMIQDCFLLGVSRSALKNACTTPHCSNSHLMDFPSDSHLVGVWLQILCGATSSSSHSFSKSAKHLEILLVLWYRSWK